jgi:uncharacterized membrane protein YjgN (DUF898 family)
MAARAEDAIAQYGNTAANAGVTEPEVARLSYHGRMAPLTLLTVSNLFLTIVTLGVYRFWARTRFRDYFWRNVSFLDDRFEYTGKGLELFLGFLIALVIIIPLGLISQAIPLLVSHGLVYPAVATVLFGVLIYFLVGFAIFRARRYRLSRTAWRGIRAGQTGSSVRFGLMWILYNALAVITLGLAAPLATVRLQRFMMDNTWFGDQRMETDYSAGQLFRRWILYWLFLVPSFGLTYVWYSAAKFRYLARHTRLDQLEFGSNLKGGRLFRVILVYALIVALSGSAIAAIFIGMFAPEIAELKQAGQWDNEADPVLQTLQVLRAMDLQSQIVFVAAVVVWYLFVSVAAMIFYIQPLIRAVAESVRITVQQDFSTLQQSTRPAPGRGEGLADSFDLSGF